MGGVWDSCTAMNITTTKTINVKSHTDAGSGCIHVAQKEATFEMPLHASSHLKNVQKNLTSFMVVDITCKTVYLYQCSKAN